MKKISYPNGVCFRSLLFGSVAWLSALTATCQPQAVFKKLTVNQNYVFKELLTAPTDSTFFISGYRQFPSHGLNVSKFDMYGNSVWSKTYNYSTYERYPDIHQTPWGDLLITTYPPNFDFRVRCVSADGNYKWGAFTSNTQFNFHTTSFPDGSIYMVNYSSAGPFVFKTDSSGNLKWKKAYWNISLYAFDFNEVTRIGASGMMIGGWSNTYGTTVIIHIDSSGAVLSSRALYPNIPAPFGLRNIKFYPVGNNKVWLAGNAGDASIVSEIDSSGNILWSRKFFASNCKINSMSFSPFPNSEIAMGGSQYDSVTVFRGSFAGKTDVAGLVISSYSIGADDSLYSHSTHHVAALRSGKIAFSTFERLLPINTVSYTLFGMVDSAYNGIGSCYTNPFQLLSDTTSLTILPLAIDSSTNTYNNYFFSPFGVTTSVVNDSLICLSTTVNEVSWPGNKIHIYPNPVSRMLYIENTKSEGSLTICDNYGRVVRQHPALEGNTEMDAGGLSPGVYIVTYRHYTTSARARFVKL